MESEKSSNVKSTRRCFSQTSHFFSYPEKAERTLVQDVAAEGDHSGSANVSELKLLEESLPYLSSSLDADIETYNKKRTRTGCAWVDESKEETDTLGRAHDNAQCNCRVCDGCRQSALGEDSQLEYLSAHEQDFDDRNSSSESSEEKEATGIKTTKLIDPVHEVPGSGIAQGQSLVDLSEDCSPTAEYGVGDQTCPEAAVSELPHLLQDSLPDCNGVTCHHWEEQTEYDSAVCGSVLESDSWGSKERVCPSPLVCYSLEEGEAKGILLSDSTLPPQTATSQEVSEKNDRFLRRVSVKQDGPLLLPREKAPAVAVQCHRCAEDSDFYACEESGVCAHGAGYVDYAARGLDAQFPVSEILTSENPFLGVEGADKSSRGNTSCLNSELECRKTLKNVTSGSPVNQEVDASSDFRACFTTSRSTSAQVCLLSRAINTVITMMNKSRPTGWHHETCVDVACNTEWSCGAASTEENHSQLTEVLEEHSDGNTATAERSSPMQEKQESKNELCSSDSKISPERLVRPDEQAVNNSAPSCCQETLQRAIEAELQILSAHYQMCYQHCLKIYSLALEGNAHFIRCSGNTELRSSVMLALEELKKNYDSMRKQIKRGTPLNALSPLSVEMKLFQISSSYVPCKLFREDLCHNSVSGTREDDFEALKLQEWKISVNMNNPRTLCLTDGGQPSDSTSSKTFEEHREDQDMEHGYVKNEEGSQYWFDAKEDLTVADFSVIPEETKKQQKNQDTVDLREAKITKSGNERSFICVDRQSCSVTEGELKSHFQKYQVSDTLTSVDFSNNRDAVLSFKDTNKAKLAVEEMDQKTIKGKRDTGEDILQKTSLPLSANSYDAFISPNMLNLSSFVKLMKKLQEVHPEASRDKIVNALLEVKNNNNGVLSGLPINSIVERTSVVLRKRTPSCGWEKQHK